MSERDRDIELEDLGNKETALEDPYEDDDRYAEEMTEDDLRVGVAGCWVHPDVPCMESCMAFNLYRGEDEPNCRVMMSLERIANGQDMAAIEKERNQILSKIEKTLAGLLQHIQRLTV